MCGCVGVCVREVVVKSIKFEYELRSFRVRSAQFTPSSAMQMRVVKKNACSKKMCIKNETVKQLYKLGIKVGRFTSCSLTPNLGSDTGLQSCETPVTWKFHQRQMRKLSWNG
jgi:hypothetical protein